MELSEITIRAFASEKQRPFSIFAVFMGKDFPAKELTIRQRFVTLCRHEKSGIYDECDRLWRVDRVAKELAWKASKV